MLLDHALMGTLVAGSCSTQRRLDAGGIMASAYAQRSGITPVGPPRPWICWQGPEKRGGPTMKRVTVLGAAGGIGSMAARTLYASEEFDEVVLADLDDQAAAEQARAWPAARASATPLHLDVSDAAELHRALTGSDIVVNCTGPFYRFGPPVLDAAIEAGTPYVDVCDDLDPTRLMLARGAAAAAQGVCAVVGMGNSPGLANILVKYCADQLLDSVTSVDIMHIHGGEPSEGPAVLKHRIHAMQSDVPIWQDGDFVSVRMLEPSGRAYVSEVDFRDVGTYPVYPYPHPETITLPVHLPGVQRVTNRGVVFPLPYFDLTRDLVLAGTCVTDPIQVGGVPGRSHRLRGGPPHGPAPPPAGRVRSGRSRGLSADRRHRSEGRRRARLRLLAVIQRGRRRGGHGDPGSAGRGPPGPWRDHHPRRPRPGGGGRPGADPGARRGTVAPPAGRRHRRQAPDPRRAHPAGRHPRGARPGPVRRVGRRWSAARPWNREARKAR